MIVKAKWQICKIFFVVLIFLHLELSLYFEFLNFKMKIYWNNEFEPLEYGGFYCLLFWIAARGLFIPIFTVWFVGNLRWRVQFFFMHLFTFFLIPAPPCTFFDVVQHFVGSYMECSTLLCLMLFLNIFRNLSQLLVSFI